MRQSCREVKLHRNGQLKREEDEGERTPLHGRTEDKEVRKHKASEDLSVIRSDTQTTGRRAENENRESWKGKLNEPSALQSR